MLPGEGHLTVFVNRVFKGEAPLRIDDLAPGSYQINLSPQGYEGVAVPVEVCGEEFGFG